MIKAIMKKYALSESGARGFVRAVLASVALDLVLMAPASILFYISRDLLSGGIPKSHVLPYQIALFSSLLLILLAEFWQYNSLYFSTYRESGARRISLSEKLRTLPLSFFAKKDVSDLTTAILGDCTAIEHAFSHLIPQFFGAMISTVVIAVALFLFNWKLALSALWPLPLSLLIVASSKPFMKFVAKKKNDSNLDLSDGIQEFIECLRELKSNDSEVPYLKKLSEKVRAAEKRAIEAELKTAVFVVSAQLLLKFGIATVALAGGSLLVSGKIDILTFFAFLIVVSRIYEPMSGTLVHLAAINMLQANIDRMNEMQNQREQTGKTEFSPENFDIRFEDVKFSYEDGKKVLDGVTFTARQGEVTALVGPSGGGKTTVSRLASRFWDADSGKITLGGTDVSTVDPETLLRNYSIVFQDVLLFNNSVMENIRIGRKGATDEEVLRAAEAANVTEFAEKLPEGFNTEIGENGARLSGGERQRISIARAFLKDAPIVLLDEATASLDAENETQVQGALSRLIEDKTVLVIAHRLRTVQNADKIVVLDGGRVAEAGTAAELLAKKGKYWEMSKN